VSKFNVRLSVKLYFVQAVTKRSLALCENCHCRRLGSCGTKWSLVFITWHCSSLIAQKLQVRECWTRDAIFVG